MLSRVANNIYWMGRYLERAEYMARYTKVQYFSMFDAPNLQNKEFVLKSIVNMTGIEYDPDKETLEEQNIILKVGLDKVSDYSIYSLVYAARENARSARNILSDELWENINTYYRFVEQFSPDYFKTRGLYEFTQEVNRHSYIIKSCVNHTMLHEYGYIIINLGIYIERTIQIIRTFSSKLSDIEILSENGKNRALKDYQWTIILKTLEAFDLYRRYFKNHNNGLNQREFILFHKTFPRSVVYNLGKLDEIINRIAAIEDGHSKMSFHAGKLYNRVKYSRSEDITDLQEFLNELLSDLYELHSRIDEELFQ